jgi:short subunit dehydrogenase-like uncharacterized protein
MLVPEGYTFTALSAVRAVEEVRARRPHGALTPALAFGKEFVTTIAGVEVGSLVRGAS